MKHKENKKLGKLLLEYNLISQKQLVNAINMQKHSSKRLGQLLIEQNFIREIDLIKVLEVQLGLEKVNLYDYNLDPKLAKYVPENLARKYMLIPINLQDDTLKLAMTDPLNLEAIDTIKINLNFNIELCIATSKEIKEAQDIIYTASNIVDNNNITFGELGQSDIEVEQSISNLARQIINNAVKQGASDIHIEPDKTKLRIRYRINGVLHIQKNLSRNILSKLISYFKVVSGVDVTKTRIPQNGRISIQVGGYAINTRVSILPTLHGEKIVIRLLLKDNRFLNVNKLGFSDNNLSKLKQLIEKPYGIILVTGPTSSGKTTTLFSSINYLNNEERNIMTIEDPIEYQLQGVYQVETSSQQDLDFSKALRSVLRQDPDIIMLGEVRDEETAQIAVRAAITGHLVISTLHTNDASSAIGRLLSLGVPSYMVQSTLLGVIAQRLVRVLCDCKKEYMPDSKERRFLGISDKEDVRFYKPQGCYRCQNTGYHGRTTIQEVLMIDDDFEKMIINRANKAEIENYAIEKGMVTLKEHAREKVLNGITSYTEIKRVIL